MISLSCEIEVVQVFNGTMVTNWVRFIVLARTLICWAPTVGARLMTDSRSTNEKGVIEIKLILTGFVGDRRIRRRAGE